MASGRLRCDLNVSLRCRDTGKDYPRVRAAPVPFVSLNLFCLSFTSRFLALFTVSFMDAWLKVELKNVRSLPAIRRALNAESRRQKETLERGRPLFPETRHWDDSLRVRMSPCLFSAAAAAAVAVSFQQQHMQLL